MIAVVPVRAGVLPAGAADAVAEAGGAAMVVGEGTKSAACELPTAVGEVGCAELGAFAPAAWAAALAPLLEAHDVVVLPGSPDGRDLAPRLAHELARPLLGPALRVGASAVTLVRWGGFVLSDHHLDGPAVATLVPGVRGESTAGGEARPPAVPVALDVAAVAGRGEVVDAEVLEVLDPDPATVDLADARRIVAGGAGLGGAEAFALLERVAVALGASYGATRLAADLGWVPWNRYIGTTGATVDPDLYVALGIAGAVQHVTGLGDPRHVVSVNTDPSAPMMAMADLAVVADAPAVLRALAERLGLDGG